MANRWRCGGCGYRLEAQVPPEECPGCREKCDFIDDSRYVPLGDGGPPGADPVAGVAVPRVVREKCTGCRKCVEACPAGAIEMRDDVAWIDPELCDGDARCIPACPEGAITAPEQTR